MAKLISITGNTYPVRDELRALGGKPTKQGDKWVWLVPEDKVQEAYAIITKGPSSNAQPAEKKPFRHYKCVSCGVAASRYVRICGSGECGDCYEERKGDY